MVYGEDNIGVAVPFAVLCRWNPRFLACPEIVDPRNHQTEEVPRQVAIGPDMIAVARENDGMRANVPVQMPGPCPVRHPKAVPVSQGRQQFPCK